MPDNKKRSPMDKALDRIVAESLLSPIERESKNREAKARISAYDNLLDAAVSRATDKRDERVKALKAANSSISQAEIEADPTVKYYTKRIDGYM